MNLRRRRRSSGRRRRNPVRRRRRNGGFGFGGFNLRTLTSRETLAPAAGVGVGVFANNLIFNKFFDKLPGASFTAGGFPVGRYLYLLGFGYGGFLLARRPAPRFAKGYLLSGPAAIITDLVAQAYAKSLNPQITGPTAGASAYLNARPVRGLSRLPGPQNHSAISMFSALPQNRQAAFADSRFGVR